MLKLNDDKNELLVFDPKRQAVVFKRLNISIGKNTETKCEVWLNYDNAATCEFYLKCLSLSTEKHP